MAPPKFKLDKDWMGPVLKGLSLASSIAVSTYVVSKFSKLVESNQVVLSKLKDQIIREKEQLTQNQLNSGGEQNHHEDHHAKAGAEGDVQQKKQIQFQMLSADSEQPQGPKINEQNQVYKICITGGPCAGKTSGLVMLSEKLRDEGFNVYTVPESATLIGNGGGQIDMTNYTPEQQKNFQKAILKTQVQLEDSFMGIAKLSQTKSVVLCDRGLMDGAAYLSPSLWNELLSQMGLTEVQLRDKRYTRPVRNRYDCVIHLVTAADGAEKFYNKDNDVRHESPDEAIVVDRKLQLAWLGHPYYEIIDNNSSLNFEDKLEKLTNKVRLAVGLPGQLSKKHKRYLLDQFKSFEEFINKNQQMKEPLKIQRFYIEDCFIQNHQPVEGEHHKIYTRVRRRGQSSQYVYSWSQSQYKHDKQISTMKKQLNQKEYYFMLTLQDPTRMSLLKERICFMQNNIFYVIDTYFNVQEGFSILKIRLQDNQEPVFPNFLSIAREVTNEKGYTSKVLAKKNWYAPQGDETILNFRKDSM